MVKYVLCGKGSGEADMHVTTEMVIGALLVLNLVGLTIAAYHILKKK